MPEIKITFPSVDFPGIGKKITDFSEPFAEFGQYRQGRIENQFREERDPYGAGWAPLSKAYLEYKQRTGKIVKIMQSSGIMRASWNYDAQPEEYREGYASRLAAFHHIVETPGRKLPQRLLLPTAERGLPEQDEVELTKLISEHSKAVFEAEGYRYVGDYSRGGKKVGGYWRKR